MTGITTVDFSNPTDSTQALAAYVAAGLPTANVVSATSGGAYRHRVGADDALRQRLCVGAPGRAGTGETNFVGGYGPQLLFGGQGANILTYLAIGDGGDRVSAFDPAKDVIDLSRIDADILTAGVQNFTFIGSAPFSGGAQVRYQLDPTNNDTIVQAALAGDTTRRFHHHARGTGAAHGRQLRAHAVSVVGRSGEWRGLVLHPGYDGRRRAD